MKVSGSASLFLTLLLFFYSCPAGSSQRPSQFKTHITGWADDSHFLIQVIDKQMSPILRSVDIRSGKEVTVRPAKSELEILSGLLPAGIQLDHKSTISPDMISVILVRENDLFIFTKGVRGLKRLTNSDEEEVNVRFSPDGKKIAYTVNKDLYFYDLSDHRETRLTFDASARIYNGYASWVYMEEILGRESSYAAFWWSPDGNRLAYLRTDETDVPVFTLNRLDEDSGIHGLLEQVPYPKAGDPNPKVKMGIADLATGRTTWVKTDYNADQYIAWPFWTPDSRKLAIQILNRDQNDLQIILADPLTGEYSEIYRERRNTWVEFFEDVYVMKNGKGFILKSYRSDWENLYYYSWDGKLISQITDFSWRVNKIQKVEEKDGIVYFTGTGPESTDNHFFRIGIDGKNLLCITNGPGSHDVSISPEGSYFIDTWSNITSPGSIIAYDRNGRQVREIHRFEQPQYEPAKHSKAEMVKIRTSDGLFDMPAMITYPLRFDPTEKYPVVFTIHGGPNRKNIPDNRWQEMTPSWYSSNGIITVNVDHRGSGHFGMKGLDYLHRSLGSWEILDYIDAVKWLLAKPYVDGSRMGITGSSYGGYTTCLALTKGSDYWTHGIAGMPVTDWRLYDNIYTERYMDTPQENPEGYKAGSALTWADNYKGTLHITHGDMDDNVHMQNSIYLISKLQDEGKTFSFMLYPDQRHGFGGEKAAHSRNAANNFWLQNFFGR